MPNSLAPLRPFPAPDPPLTSELPRRPLHLLPTSPSSSSDSVLPAPEPMRREDCVLEKETATLGDVLQKIAALSPTHIHGIDVLARHILRSLVTGGRGLMQACLLSGSGVCIAAIARDYAWMF